MQLLRHLSDNISQFWTAQNVKDVIHAYLSLMGRDNTLDKGPIQKFGRYMARKLPTHSFVEAFDDIRKETSSQGSAPSTQPDAFFALLRPAIKAANKKDVEAYSRTLLGFFIDAWDVPQVHLHQVLSCVRLIVFFRSLLRVRRQFGHSLI